MSIHDVVQDWVDRGELSLLTPVLDSDPVVRCLFVSRDIYAAVNDFGDGIDERMGRLREHLEVFIRGDVITVAMDSYHAKHAYMSRLEPRADEIWEIRDRSRRPSIRTFGSFADRDTFVALTWQWRSILGAPVKRARDAAKKIAAASVATSQSWPKVWPIEQRACRAEWRRKFQSYDPCNGSSPDEYLTNWLPVGDLGRWQD